MPRKSRAEPLAPQERRRKIVEAVLPLLVERGGAVSTREIAEAAEIAEGTLFTVFPDKRAVILAAIEHRLDPAPLTRRLAEVDPGAPLATQLLAAARLITDGSEEVAALAGILRTLPSNEKKPAGPPRFFIEWREAVTEGLIGILEPHRTELRTEPGKAASAFVALLFASRLPVTGPKPSLKPEEIVDILLHGIAEPSRDRGPDAS